MSIIGGLLPWVDQQFHDDAGVPISGGFVEFFVSGLSTHKDTFSSADLDPTGVNSNPVVLDSAGRPPVAIFLEAGGYDVEIRDSNSVLIQTLEGIEDIGQTILASFGQINVSGSRNVVSGYTILPTDYFITVNGSGGPDPTIINMMPVIDRAQAITIKNLGSTGVQVTPNGIDTVELTLSSYTINAVTTPTILPTVTFAPSTADSSYLIDSSHAQ